MSNDEQLICSVSKATELHGPLFSEDSNPRAHIFAATAPEVSSLKDMREEMQRNRWPHEVDGGSRTSLGCLC